MRVLVVTPSYPTPEAPAAGVFVREHALAADDGADVAVLHLDRRSGARGVRVERVAAEPLATWRVAYPASPLPLSLAAYLPAAIAGYRAVRRSGFRPDVLHAHFFLAALPALVIGAFARLPTVVTEHWSVFIRSRPPDLSPPLRLLARLAFSRARLVLAVSELLRDALLAEGVHTEIRVVPNVVDTELFHPDGAPGGDVRRLLCVGLFYDAKAHDVLLRAVARLRARRSDFHLDLVGDGPLRAPYERLVDELGIRDLVTFHGLRPKEEVARRMREADLFVLTSRYDNNPCAVLEALSSGLPVVATAVGGIPELVGDGNGLLAPSGDADAVADRIDEALAVATHFDRAAIAAAAQARYGRERVAAELARAYADAVGAAG